ncbi:hypothetical protein N864_05100 [Intrasporangium chromatireducens Q5-1]|uniref:Conjugal transfer protein TrbL n=1 Tax=Intrasporangium chromatireducens Q5-1 TaxID=584657 RepID=W9GKM2_9MICO|nr:hypothetical protein [Intrasporangium chromatireducens]EWT05373.1 hypothetical protein N864_05100 [Intrasporangium chromatireducens Q5-1]
MSCTGVDMLNPACQIASAAGSITESAFGTIATSFGEAATTATGWLWSQIDTATTVDLASPQLRKEMAVTGAIALVISLGLFTLQLITATLRRDPGGLGRAVKGLFIMALGSGFALAATRILLAAVDALADGVVQHTLGTSVHGIGALFALADMTNLANPAVMLVLAIAVLAATVVVWFAMMIRKLLLIVCAVLAPLAFAGATADITRSWVRKWVEFVVAMIAAKLILVLILVTGILVMQGAGLAGSQPTQIGTQLAVGALILLLGGLSPWLAVRMCVFVGDSLYAAHLTAGHAAAGGRVAMNAPQKVAYLRSSMAGAAGARAGSRAVGAGGASAVGAAATGPKLNPPGKTDSERRNLVTVPSQGGDGMRGRHESPTSMRTGTGHASVTETAGGGPTNSAQRHTTPPTPPAYERVTRPERKDES